MNRGLKRIRWAGGILAVLLLVLGAITAGKKWSGARALEARKAGLRAAGEELSLAALIPRRPAPEANGASVFQDITNTVESAAPRDGASPGLFGFAAPGRVVASARLESWVDSTGSRRAWDEAFEHVDKWRPLIGRLEAAAALPVFDSGFDYGKGFLELEFHAHGLLLRKTSARLLGLAVECDLRRGRLEDSWRHVSALAAMAAQECEPMVINQLVRQACGVLAAGAAWELLLHPGLDEGRLASLQAVWARVDYPRDLGRAMETERAMALDVFRQVRGSFQSLAKGLDARAGGGGTGAAALARRSVIAPLWRVAWAEQDELLMLNRWQGIIERARFARSNSWVALQARPAGQEAGAPAFGAKDETSETGWVAAASRAYQTVSLQFSGAEFGLDDTTVYNTLRFQTQQQMVLAALALRRFELREGRLPGSLDALVPAFLPALPRDYIDGKPLRYRRRPEGGYLLYSVGRNGLDDGGNPAPESARTPPGMWRGLDALWPSPASPEEIQARDASRKPRGRAR